MKRSLAAIWNARFVAFARETRPYFRYMSMSGFPAVFVLLLIVASIGYMQLLEQVPPDFPFATIGVVLFTPLVSWSPLRTWLRPPDIVFLSRREAEMGEYIAKSAIYNLIPGALLALIGLALYWPIYRHGPGMSGVWTLAAALLAMKAANAAVAWQERRMAWPAARRVSRLLRWALTAAAIALFLVQQPWKAWLFAALACATGMLAVKLAQRFRFPWERLIAEERRTIRRYYAFFSMFIDVPTLDSPAAPRRYLSWITKRVPYRPDTAFVYLYAHTFIRTEIGGIVIRLVLVGASAIVVFGSGEWLGGWLAAAVYLAFVGMIGMQAGTLPLVHRHTVWRHVYPLPAADRIRSLLAVDRAAMVAASVMLWLPAAFVLLPQKLFAQAFAPLALAELYILLIRPGRLKRKIAVESDSLSD